MSLLLILCFFLRLHSLLSWNLSQVKLSDSTANIYLELAAILSSGMNGIVAGEALRPRSNEVSANVGIVGEDEDLNVESDSRTDLSVKIIQVLCKLEAQRGFLCNRRLCKILIRTLRVREETTSRENKIASLPLSLLQPRISFWAGNTYLRVGTSLESTSMDSTPQSYFCSCPPLLHYILSRERRLTLNMPICQRVVQ